MTLRVLRVGLAAGLLFAVLDGVVNANPLAQRLYAAYKPIARTSVNAAAGIAIDLAYGVAMAWVFVLLRGSLPGTGVWKGVSFGLIAWFFRVVMGALGQWMMFRIPGSAVAYTMAAGLAEMVAIGVLLGMLLR